MPVAPTTNLGARGAAVQTSGPLSACAAGRTPLHPPCRACRVRSCADCRARLRCLQRRQPPDALGGRLLCPGWVLRYDLRRRHAIPIGSAPTSRSAPEESSGVTGTGLSEASMVILDPPP